MTTRTNPPGSAGSATIATTRIELLDTDPLIWREVEVPISLTLAELHEVIQAMVGWEDYHLWEFTIAKQRYGLPMEDDRGAAPRLDAAATRLADVMKPRRTGFDYLYDFGDNWELRVTVEKARAAEPGAVYPRFVAGAMNAPPEDCGGVWGFYDKLDVLKDPDDPEHEELSEWFGDYNPAQVDEAGIRAKLAKLTSSGKPPRARRTKPS